MANDESGLLSSPISRCKWFSVVCSSIHSCSFASKARHLEHPPSPWVRNADVETSQLTRITTRQEESVSIEDLHLVSSKIEGGHPVVKKPHSKWAWYDHVCNSVEMSLLDWNYVLTKTTDCKAFVCLKTATIVVVVNNWFRLMLRTFAGMIVFQCPRPHTRYEIPSLRS